MFGDLAPQVDAATKGLQDWDGKARLAGESARLFGDDAEGLDRALGTAGANGFTKATDAVSKFVLGLFGADQQFTRTQERISAVDQILSELVRTGHMQEAVELMTILASRAGISVEQLLKVLPGFAAAMETSGDKTEALAEAAGDASRELTNLTQSAKSHVGVVFSLEEAQDKAADAVQRLKDQIKKQREEHDKNATALTGSSQTARDNRDSVRDLVGIYQDLISRTAEAGKSTNGLDKQLEDTLVQMGFNRDEAHRYVKELSLIPDEVTTKVSLETKGALHEAQETARELHRMLGGVTTVTVSARDPMAGGHAHGGITGAESGGLRGGWTMTGERGRELVKLPYGSTVYPHGTTEAMLAGGGGGAGATVHLHLHVDGREVRNWLRDDAVKRNVSADVIRVAYP
jgi:hypothetical protein